MPRILLATIIGGVLLAFAAAAPALAREQPGPPKPGVLFTGKEIQRPPQAGKEWKPPETSLPESWISTMRLLLSYGFADPRGCEYREVELTCGSLWSKKGMLIPTHAWALPRQESDPPDAPRFAVAWNGIVYPVVSVGAPADLHVDVEQQLHSRPYFRAHEESEQVSYDRGSSLKGCLLLILGEAELAEQLWKITPPHAWSRSSESPKDLNFDPYVELVYEWAWAQHDRALCAHLRGDDVVSLASAKLLVPLRDAVEKEAVARGIERHLPGINEAIRPFLPFLDRVHVLADDAARRVAAGPLERVLAPGAAPIADQQARIAALIRDLETVDVTQGGQPGGVFVGESPLVAALAKEGLPAVEPLLDCLEHDTRLIRSVQFHRDFFPSREYLTVKRPAGAALGEIGKGRDIGRTIPEMRENYREVLTRIDAEHWFTILKWDKSSPEECLEAARHLVEPAPPDPTQLAEVLEAEDAPRLFGEPVRSRRDPSVIRLLDRQAMSLASPAKIDPREIRDFQAACRRFQLSCRLTLCLAKWDLPCGLPECRRRLHEYRALESEPLWQPYTP